MTSNQLKKLTVHAIEVVERAADFIRSEAGAVDSDSIEEKALNSLVSYVDRTAEEILVEGLSTLDRGATFLTEEDTVSNQASDMVWIIDPLDGTTNFLHNLPFYSVSVALELERTLVIGIVLEVPRKELFHCYHGGGSYHNDRVIRVNQGRPLDQSVIATGFPYDDLNCLENYMDVFQTFVKRTRGVRRFGSAALDLAYVAAGRLDGYYEYNLNPWDVSAGGLLIQEAGGKTCGFFDDDSWSTGMSLIGSSSYVMDEMREIIASRMPQHALGR
ncbi:MAG: inositol monophosphatase [Saprospiraceae bacterium]|nr:inositol monophosphatase [Saprospiraceae bacterium]